MSAPMSVNARNSVEISNNTCCPFLGKKKHKHRDSCEKAKRASREVLEKAGVPPSPIPRRDAQDPLPSSPGGLHTPQGFVPGGYVKDGITYGNMPAIPEGSK